MGGYEMIREALVDAGLLAQGASEAQFMAMFDQACALIATAMAATGQAWTATRVASELAMGGLFAQRVAQSIRVGRSLAALGGTGRGSIARMVSPAARSGFALLPEGLLSAPALLAGAAIFIAASAGLYMYSNWGKPSSEPVKAGPVGDPAQRGFGGNTLTAQELEDCRRGVPPAPRIGSGPWPACPPDSRPAPPGTTESRPAPPGATEINCHKYCMDISSIAPSDYMKCLAISRDATGTQQQCADMAALAKAGKLSPTR